MNESGEIRGSGATFRYQDRIWIGCHVSVPGYYMRIGVSRSDTRIEYGSGVTFRHQDRMRIGVSRTDTRGIKIMNLER